MGVCRLGHRELQDGESLGQPHMGLSAFEVLVAFTPAVQVG